jgi:2-succinyl-5-enolpyruvyl-6-hydroxy-3-cyclohexene-1-carboxylate synthase
MYSNKAAVRLLFDLLQHHGIQHLVFSPGSRNAPLLIEAEARSAHFHTYTLPDERAAGFFALGLALQSGKPALVCCTSGSAVVNYYPAVTEAFYQKIPLVVVSADRPAAWIDRGDGQTIRQVGVFSNHIVDQAAIAGEMNGPETSAEVGATLHRLLEVAQIQRGPVHLNISFEEPLYGTVEVTSPLWTPHVLPVKPLIESPVQEALQAWSAAQRRWILVGQLEENHGLNAILEELAKNPSVVILSETTSNLSLRQGFHAIDRLLHTLPEREWSAVVPEVLLTLGGAVISKKIKSLLRKHKPRHHIHVQDTSGHPDTFEALDFPIWTHPIDFLSQLSTPPGEDLQQRLQPWFDRAQQSTHTYAEVAPFSDWLVFYRLSQWIQPGMIVHAGNSSVVRYLQLFDQPQVPFMGNRGTSGIDGSLSVASGFAQEDSRLNISILGDLSFAYDSNALFHNHPTPNLRILVINNGGGGIFRIIDGPQSTGPLADAFVAKTPYRLAGLAQAFGADYLWAENEAQLLDQWERFIGPSPRTIIMEVITPEYENHLVLNQYFNYLAHGQHAQLDPH